MMTPEQPFVWFLLGGVAPICLAAYLVQWVAGKVRFWYVDKVLDAARTRHAGRHRRVKPTASGGLPRNGFSAPV